MGVLDGKLGDVDAGNGRPADVGGLSDEDAVMFRQMENGGDNAGPEDLPADPPADDPGDTVDRGADDDGDAVDPLDHPLRLPGEKRERLDADADDEAEPDEDELPPENPSQQTVSYGKHRRELKKQADKIKALKAEVAKAGGSAELQAERLKTARLEERLTMIVDALNSKKQAAEKQEEVDDDPEPDVKEHPFEHGEWLARDNKRLKAEMRALRERQDKGETTRTADQESRALEQSYVTACQQYAQKDETFAIAYRHLQNSRFAEIADAKFGKDIYSEEPEHKLSDAEAQAVRVQFQREEEAVASQELKANRNPAHRIMRMARARGFDKTAAEKMIADYKAKNGGGKQPNGKDDQPAKRSVTEEVKAIQKRREGSKSLSDGGSAPANGRLTMRQVADMPKGDFDALLNRLGKDAYEEVLLGKDTA